MAPDIYLITNDSQYALAGDDLKYPTFQYRGPIV
jgi:hypothetical protein